MYWTSTSDIILYIFMTCESELSTDTIYINNKPELHKRRCTIEEEFDNAVGDVLLLNSDGVGKHAVHSSILWDNRTCIIILLTNIHVRSI